MIVLLILGLDIGHPLCVLVLLLILKIDKYLWLVPIIFIIANAIYVISNILSLYTYMPLNERIRLYFVNDSSMGLYIIHIPMVLFSIISTLCYILMRKYTNIVN
jgi:hypothetical protein